MLKLRDFFGIFLLAFLWSTSFLVVRIVVEHVHPVTLTFFRCFSAALFIYLILFILRKNFRTSIPSWRIFIFTSLLINAIPFTLCAIGEVFVDSSTASVLEGTIPMFTLLLARFWMKNKINKSQVMGIIVGVIGLIIIFGPSMMKSSHQNRLGVFMLLGMALFFAIGFLYSEKHLKNAPPLQTTALHMLTASLFLLPISFAADHSLQTISLSTHIIILIIVLGALGTGLGWLTYFYLLNRISVTYIAISTILIPLFGLMWGYFLLSEPITWNKLVGASVVLFSVCLMEHSLRPHLQKFFGFFVR